MRRALISENDAAAAIGLTIPSTPGQKIDYPSQAAQLGILFGHNL